MIRGIAQPRTHRVRGHLEHAGDRTNAQPCRQRTNRPDEPIGWHPLPVQRRAMRLKKIPATLAAIELSPGAATGMTVGCDMAQPQPATIVTVGIGTEMMRG